MKSSTIRRSTLSKESMQVIENLSKEQERQIDNNISEQEIVETNNSIEQKEPEETSHNKEKELDLLWQNFVPSQITSGSPIKTGIIGFILGVVTTLLVVIGIYTYANHQVISPETNSINQEEPAVEEAQLEDETTEKAKVDIPSEQATPAATQDEQANQPEKVQTNDEKTNTKMKKYVVKNGDTGENIIKHFYGSYSPELADKVMKANNLKSLDRINIDQELLIPEK